MKSQSKKDKMDEHLGMKDGKESKHKQSMKDRRDEMEGMLHRKKRAVKHTKKDLEKAYGHMRQSMK